ncbi:MAG: fumarate reductase/succinate dehydrogenase flavoprotein subunit [Chloroherpetonaceae bacterium]|nr:fumarate reductase/succinate dehydrogenase flavoprotein subunit [Chthonomonadaceae bacterium]MDW8206311.1 fumarate reductase/succinate dehydrogenase flavoprotein subunit [Chloroherpetonaceae bacterium]
MENYETYEYDVLVVGAGGAGLRAVIAAREAGCSVGLVCKSLLGKAHTVMAEGGVAAALNNMTNPDGTKEGDSWEVHFVDTMKGGAFLNNWRMVEIFAKEAPERVLELEQYGAVFDRTPEGLIAQRPFGGHRYRRLNHVGDRTGLELIRTLQDKAVGVGMNVHMEVTLTRLLKDGDRVVGAFGYYRSSGKFVVFRARAVVLATGGWGRMYMYTSNSWEGTGDGVMMACEAGAELIDMEMVQFHPTGMIWPPGMRGILVTEGVRGEGGILLNSKGERFMFNPEYMPPLYKGQFAETPEEAERWLVDKKNNRRPPELLPRDVVARAIYREVEAGRGSKHGGVYLDVTHRGAEYIKRKLPSMYEQFHALGNLDITKEPMEVYPTIHYAMGGIRVEPETGATSVPGLFAAGEVAGGLHGANRLGGNSLSDIIVFGKRAGDGAAAYAKTVEHGTIDPAQIEEEVDYLLAPLEAQSGENPYQIHQELQEAMQKHCMIARTEKGLLTCLEKIQELRRRAQNLKVDGDRFFNPGWHAARDIRFMLKTSEVIVRCALERQESRGAQWRLDYPDRDDAFWGKVNLIVTQVGDQFRIERRPLPEMPAELKALIEKYGK